MINLPSWRKRATLLLPYFHFFYNVLFWSRIFDLLCVISCSSFPCACHVTKSSLLCFELFCFGFAAAFLSIWSLWPEAKGLRQVSHACGVGAQTNSNIHNTHTHTHTHTHTNSCPFFWECCPFALCSLMLWLLLL